MKSSRMIFLIPLLAIAAWAQDVRYNFASDTNFSKYRTYKWVQIKGADPIDQITENQLKSAVDAELATKGLTRTEGDTADLYVGYQVSLGKEKQVTSYDSGWGYGPGWGGWGYAGGGGGFSTATTSTIVIGQVDLDMYDPAAKTLVWRGTASKTLDPKAKPDKREKNLKKGVAKLLKNYPPPPKKG
jgi:Domain of unknown function (DUF4136)